MKTLKEVLKERGVSMAHVAKVNDISPQSLNRYKDSPSQMAHPSSKNIYIFSGIGDKDIYSSTGNPLPKAVYMLIRIFKL